MTDDLAIAISVDFFTPVVDDPYDYGRISAANSLSDLYAMGAKPFAALNVVCFPTDVLGLEVLNTILKGGEDKAREAGIPIIGGHSIKGQEPTYGLVVLGTVHPRKIIANSTACPGDALVLTKPIGTGILTTALKRGLLDRSLVEEVTRSMATLNKGAFEAMIDVGINACTDITGYGLLGHLGEMIDGSSVGARISFGRVPIFPEVLDFIAQDVIPGGTRANLDFVRSKVAFSDAVQLHQQIVLADAQTSGGLLISLPRERLDALLAKLREKGVERFAPIGEVTEKRGLIEVIP
jgi:selenide,water dikinase